MPSLNPIGDKNDILYKHVTGNNYSLNKHIHDGCEIYFFISGHGNYFVEKSLYPLEHGGVYLTREEELHAPVLDNKSLYERIYIQFNPDIIRNVFGENSHLLSCFYQRGIGENNRLYLSDTELEEAKRIFKRFEKADYYDEESYKALKYAYLIQLLVFINNISRKEYFDYAHIELPDKLSDILKYIDANLAEEISLQDLGDNFYIDKFYLCRLFKKTIGVSIHDYIIHKRIGKAKLHLTNGYNVTDTANMCGFSDYSNFIRVFGKKVGMTPGKYRKDHLND